MTEHRRNSRVLALGLAALIALVAIPAAAFALPGDPPIESLNPPDQTSLAAGETGSVHVSFKCPSYHKQADELGSDIDYKVRFSTSSARDAEGLIGTNLGIAFAALEPDKSTCGADFEAPVPARPTALYQGTVYWQVVRQVIRPRMPHLWARDPEAERRTRSKRRRRSGQGRRSLRNGNGLRPQGAI